MMQVCQYQDNYASEMYAPSWQELCEELVDAALGGIEGSALDAAWHGGCLALAEFLRRGLLKTTRLPALAPLMCRALHYDVRRGAHRYNCAGSDRGWGWVILCSRT